MPQHISAVTIVVDDYDRAIAFYVDVMGFSLINDVAQPDGKRWVTVLPQGSDGCALLLAKAVNIEQASRIGDQTGGRVLLFLTTDNFDQDYKSLRQNGVIFHEAPRHEPYGKVVVFSDPFGNKWDLIEPV